MQLDVHHSDGNIKRPRTPTERQEPGSSFAATRHSHNYLAIVCILVEFSFALSYGDGSYAVAYTV